METRSIAYREKTLATMKLFLENVRCFRAPVQATIKPLTILVGENSSGKTTFMASFAAVFGRPGFPARFRFNSEPFEFGNFDSIASLGDNGPSNSITVGGERDGMSMKAEFSGKGSDFYLNRFELGFEAHELVLSVLQDEKKPRAEVVGTVDGEDVRAVFAFEARLFDNPFFMDSTYVVVELLEAALRGVKSRKRKGKNEFRRFISEYLEPFRNTSHKGVFALAPLRAKPRRTYDVIGTRYAPEGDDLPQLLAELIGENPEGFARLLKVGQSAGLFRDIQVETMGRQSSDLKIQVLDQAGNIVNLADVGYGVSQVLPILIHCLNRDSWGTLLLQQPEVHLHPRAQAALGTLVAEVAKNRRILVETHSDYLIDRVRMEVASGNLDPSMVVILFFDRQARDSSIFEIGIDSSGSITGAPPRYRSFFLQEQKRMLDLL